MMLKVRCATKMCSSMGNFLVFSSIVTAAVFGGYERKGKSSRRKQANPQQKGWTNPQSERGKSARRIC
jgi:hypothetical protein